MRGPAGSTSAPDPASLSSRGDPAYFIVLLILNVWGFGIQGLLAPLAGALAKDLRLEAGDIAISWFLALFLAVYALFTVVWAYQAERTSRHHALVFASVMWGMCCLGLTLATDAAGFALGWGLAAIGNAAIIPLTYSMAVDLVPAERRGRAFGYLATAQILSMGSALLVGGLAVDRFGWRVPFWFFGMQGLLSAGMLLVWKRYEPQRGAMEASLQSLFAEGKVYDYRLRLRDLKVLLEPRSNLYLLLSAVLASVPIAGLATWFIRAMQKDHGFSTATASLFMTLLSCSQVPGSIAIGRACDRAKAKRVDGAVRLLLGIQLLVLPVFFFGLRIPIDGEEGKWLAYGAFGGLVLVGSYLTAGISPLFFNAVGDINRPETRGVMFALLNIAKVAGRALGGVGVTYLSAVLYEGELSPALSLVNLTLLPAALLLVPVMRAAKRDRSAFEAHLERYVEAHRPPKHPG